MAPRQHGMLYLSTGDGGGTHDPFGNAQSLAVLFGKVSNAIQKVIP